MKAYPLSWPPGWRRTKERTRAHFSQRSQGSFGSYHARLTIAQGTKRVVQQLRAFGVEEGDAIVSTNLKLRLDGLPKGDQSEPADPGVAVYWQRAKDTQHKVMALDRYDRVADNLAAIAATLDAMRAIERHGGGVILERAFLGFQCLPAPNRVRHYTWRAVLGFDETYQNVDLTQVRAKYRTLCNFHHPDRPTGSDAKMAELNWAKEEAEKELRT